MTTKSETPAVQPSLYFDDERRVVVTEDIVSAVCQAGGVSESELLSHNKSQNIVRVRRAAYWLLRRLRYMPYEQIGERMHRDHSTVIDAMRCIHRDANENAAEFEMIANIVMRACAIIKRDYPGDIESLADIRNFVDGEATKRMAVNGDKATLYLTKDGKTIPPNEIHALAAFVCGIDFSMMKQYPRWAESRDANRVAAWMIRKLCNLSFPDICKAMQSGSHSSSINHVKCALRETERSPEFCAKIGKVASMLEDRYGGGVPSIRALAMPWEWA